MKRQHDVQVLVGIFVLIILFYSGSLRAAPSEAFDAPKVVAVEPRMFSPQHDVTAQLSILPLDAFYKGFAAGVSYTYSGSSAWSWEIVNANLNSKSDTNLKRDLTEKFNVRPQGILDHVTWYGTTNAIYTPIYSKNLLFNKDLLYGSSSFVFGGGMVGFSGGDTAALLGGGAIIRVFHSPRRSSKFDFRLYMHTASGKSSDMILLLTYGLSFELGSGASEAVR